MSELRDIIRFYRDCYQTDLKGVRIRNFVSSQCEKRYIPDNNELFSSGLLKIPVDTKWGKEIEQSLFLHSKEKALYAGSVFVRGIQNTIGRKVSAYTPLYIHELDLEVVDDVYFVSVRDTFFNPDFIELINNKDQALALNLDTISNNAPAHPFGFDNLALLKHFLDSHLNSWGIDDLDQYLDADFDHSSYYKKVASDKADEKRIYSCLMFGLFKKPSGSLGVLSELDRLSEEVPHSYLLDHLFQLRDCPPKERIERDIILPTTLSHKQESAFYGVDAYPITQIIGPPGTGKSYTISALAIDAITNNKSVLIVTRNAQASRVIANIIEKQFGLKKAIIKAYDQHYKRSLVPRLSKAISLSSNRVDRPHRLAQKIKKIIAQIQKIENSIIDIGESEYEWGEFYAQNQKDFFSIFKDKWYQYRKRANAPIWKLNQQLKALRSEKIRLVKKYIKIKTRYDLHDTIAKRKLEFFKLNNALKESNLTALDQKLHKVDFELVLQAIPLWTTTTKEISKCIPLTNDLFDLVIFDEASQCDMATAIPAIYRAKKLIAVGDPHQLRHISFLSSDKQRELRSKNSVTRNVPDYRKESLIDWTDQTLANPDQTTYLDEHFRSKTDIIQFSNRKFYDGELNIIRSNPISDQSRSLEHARINGKRNSKGVNDAEISEIVRRLMEIVEAHKESINDAVPTIGIASPFSEQVKQLKRAVANALPFDQLKRHNVLIGTPFHFQGEERDVMLISFCVDCDSHPGAINYLNKPDVFNVLVTRARNKQIIYSSISPNELPTKSLLREYLEYNAQEPTTITSDTYYDKYYTEVSTFLKNAGYDVLQQSTIVSGVLIDLVIITDDQYICIDLIGYPGEFEDQFSLEDLRILNRLEAPVFFLPFSSWHLDQEKTKTNLLKFIKETAQKN